MKKKMAVLAAFIIGIVSCICPSRASAMVSPDRQDLAAGMEEKSVSNGDALPGGEDSGGKPGDIEDSSTGTGTSVPGDQDVEEPMAEGQDMACLQIPQKLSVVIDPWELDGRGQIYSEQYTIRNAGEETGILTISFQCILQEGSGVAAVGNEDGLHAGQEKAFYAEVRLGNGDFIVLSQEETRYQACLETGEELLLWFDGAVNEYAASPWKDGDVEIESVYTWEPEETAQADAVSCGDAETEGYTVSSGDAAEEGNTVSSGDVAEEEDAAQPGEVPISSGETGTEEDAGSSGDAGDGEVPAQPEETDAPGQTAPSGDGAAEGSTVSSGDREGVQDAASSA